MRDNTPITIAPITFTKGDVYFIVDFYCMIGFNASYVGLAEGGESCDDDIMVFERVDATKDQYLYAGVIPECAADQTFGKDKRDVIGITLRAHYYGMTIDTLKHINAREKKGWKVIS